MNCSYCSEPAWMRVIEVFSNIDFTHRDLCPRCGTHRFQQMDQEVSGWACSQPAESRDGGIRFLITFLFIYETSEQQHVILQEAGGRRKLPLVIGTGEAAALERRLRHLSHPRPLTHDAWAQTISALNADLQDVLIAELRNDVYYARLRLSVTPQPQSSPNTGIQEAGRGLALPAGGWGTVEIDVRPSDALVMALVENVPIFVSEEVLQVKEALDRAHLQGTVAGTIPGENTAGQAFELPPLPPPATSFEEGKPPPRPWWKLWK